MENISAVQLLHSVVINVVLVHAHEDNVDCDTQSDEQLHEGIKDNEGQDFRYFDPSSAAVPDTENLAALLEVTLQNILQLRTFIVIVQVIVVIIIQHACLSLGYSVDDLVEDENILKHM